MDKKLKSKWVKALRGGKFKQGRGQLLNTDNRYCCLGVLCTIKGVELRPGLGVADPTWNGQYHSLFPDIEASHLERLWRMNDGADSKTEFKEHSFTEIADYIEANL